MLKININYRSKWNFSSLLVAGQGATANVSPVCVSNSTALGIVARLCGEVAKMQTLKLLDPIWNDVEKYIKVEDNPIHQMNDVMFLRTQGQVDGSQDGGIGGVLSQQALDIFSKKIYINTFKQLFLPLEDALNYVLSGRLRDINTTNLDPLKIHSRMVKIRGMQDVIADEQCKQLILASKAFCKEHGIEFEEPKKISAANVYNFAVNKYFLENVKTQKEFSDTKSNISGIGKRPLSYIDPRAFIFGSNTKGSFIPSLMTVRKMQDGAPLDALAHNKKQESGKEHLKFDESMATKSDGNLIIAIEMDQVTENKIYERICNSGIEVFHVGKKGLAYIDSIERSHV